MYVTGGLLFGMISPRLKTELWCYAIQVTASSFWNFDTTVEQRRMIYESSTLTMNLLRDITPGAGAYQVSNALRRGIQ